MMRRGSGVGELEGGEVEEVLTARVGELVATTTRCG